MVSQKKRYYPKWTFEKYLFGTPFIDWFYTNQILSLSIDWFATKQLSTSLWPLAEAAQKKQNKLTKQPSAVLFVFEEEGAGQKL